MARGFGYWVYRVCRGLVRLCYPRPELVGVERLPEGPCVIVGNHAHTHGPIVAELYIPGKRAVWCNGEMMHLKEVPDYAYRDFWSGKPAAIRWLYRLLSYLIAPLAVAIFNNAHCIGVYRDSRIMTTFRQTLERLENSERIIIFPERNAPYNDILCAFQDRFIDLGRMFGHQTGKSLAFVPMYLAPALKKAVFGEPIYYDPAARPDEERRRVCAALQEDITCLARGLPRHRVVPYLNVPRRKYPMNKPTEDAK